MLVEVNFATPLYHESYLLRDQYLRKPLGLAFDQRDIQKEYQYKHWGWLDKDGGLQASLMYSWIEEDTWKMRQVVVESAFRGLGLGKKIVLESERMMKWEYGLEVIELNARKPVVGFYKQLGYQEVGEEFIEVGIVHQKMRKN